MSILDCDRLLCAKTIIVVGTVWGLAVSRKMWTSPRYCPKTPLLNNLPPLCCEHRLYQLLFVSLACIAAIEKPVVTIFAFSTLVSILCAYDWTRFRPWLYQNSFLLLAIGICNWDGATTVHQQEALDIGRLITVAIYFWSGVLKLNRVFPAIVFPWIMEPVLRRLSLPQRGLLLGLSWAVPWLEAGLAVGLLFPSTRMLSMAGAIVMHCIILYCFSPLGHRTHPTIWPWNLSMLLTGVIFFWSTNNISIWHIVVGRHSPFHWVALLLFGALPILGLFNLLDPVFSHGHMTGRHVFGCISLTSRLFYRLPKEIRIHCVKSPQSNGKVVFLLDVSRWYMQELRVPPPQQERLLRLIARDFGRFGASDKNLSLTLFRMPGVFSTSYPQQTYSWSELFTKPSTSAVVAL